MGADLTITGANAQHISMPIPRFLTPDQIAFDSHDNGAWIIKDVTGSTRYLGFSDIGAPINQALWKIRKENDFDGSGTTIQYADGNANFDNVWDARGSLTYV